MAEEIKDLQKIQNLLQGPDLQQDRLRLLEAEIATDEKTRVPNMRELFIGHKIAAPIEVEQTFKASFAELQRHARMRPQPGLLALALDQNDNPVGSLWLELPEKGLRSFIIGRHHLCDLSVPTRFKGVSLRHLAVLVWRDEQGGLRQRVVDLHTRTGFSDELGELQASLDSDGLLFLRLEDLRLMISPCDAGMLDFADAEAAYKALPKRVFANEKDKLDDDKAADPNAKKNPFTEGRETSHGKDLKPLVKQAEGEDSNRVRLEVRPAKQDDGKKKMRNQAAQDAKAASKVDSMVHKFPRPAPSKVMYDSQVSHILRINGPIDASKIHHYVAKSESIYGCLSYHKGLHEKKEAFGISALQRGVLIGRYDRCVLGWQDEFSADDSISRVHLLLILIEGQLYAVDAASTNGVFFAKQEFMSMRVEFGDHITLCEASAELVWERAKEGKSRDFVPRS